jgi:SAM-dependent methyltransferase
MLMADPAAALRETRRVLREGGRLSFAVWAGPERNPWAAIPGMTMVELGYLPAPEPGAPGIFAMGDPNRIVEFVTGVGFGEPRIEEVSVEWGYSDAATHWEKTLELAAPIAEAFGGLSEEDRARTEATVIERAGKRLAEDPQGLDGVALAVVAE